MAEVIKSQKDLRLDRNGRDQFGRLYLLSVEKTTMQPCGNIDTCFSDPLRTPQRYITVGKDEFGNYQPSKLEVGLAQWAKHQREAQTDWRRRLLQIAQEKSPGGFEIATVEQNEWLVGLTGPKPWPTAEVLGAAAKGDKQYLGLEPLDALHRKALGLDTLSDIEAAIAADGLPVAPTGDDVPPETYRQFVAWAIRTGAATNIKEAAPLWQEHKAALQEA